MKITLKKKKLKNGMFSHYIEYYKGSQLNKDGKRIHIREFEYLKEYSYQDPKTPAEKKENKNVEKLCDEIFTIKKTSYIQGKYDIKDTVKSKRRFLDYFVEKTEEKVDSPKNYGNWSATLVHLKRCIAPTILFEDIDENFVKQIRVYFDKEAKTKSDLPLSLNSKYSYFNKFKACLRAAFDDGYLSINYASKVKSFEQAESQREYLTHQELQALASTNCKYEVLKRAFLFSCLCGLRWSDINKLVWSEVRDEDNDVSKLNFIQQKIDGVEYLYISPQARGLLGERQLQSERVFKGLKYSATYNNEIVKWCNKAGISKHITFHSARHTNAVQLLENGADIYTVSKLLGHREIRTTSIYAKIVDKKMKEAANLIPILNFTI